MEKIGIISETEAGLLYDNVKEVFYGNADGFSLVRRRQ